MFTDAFDTIPLLRPPANTQHQRRQDEEHPSRRNSRGRKEIRGSVCRRKDEYVDNGVQIGSAAGGGEAEGCIQRGVRQAWAAVRKTRPITAVASRSFSLSVRCVNC